MNASSAFRLALFVVAAAVTLLLFGIVVTKGVRELRDRHRDRLVIAVRPIVLSALEGDDALNRAAALTGRRQSVAESMAIALLPQLRGSDRIALAGLLEATGMTAKAVKGLSSWRAGRRQRSAEMLGAAGHHSAVPALVDRLTDTDAEVRIAAARALGRIGDAGAVEHLFTALDTRRVPANTASMAILRIGVTGAPAIHAALTAAVPRTRATAAELAGALGLTPLRLRIEQLLVDESPLVRVGAARSLGRLASPGSAPTLIERLKHLEHDDDDPMPCDEAVAIIDALGHIGERTCIPALEASLSGEARVAAAAGAALARLGQRRSPRSVAERAAPSPAPSASTRHSPEHGFSISAT